MDFSGSGIYNGLIIVKQRNEKLLKCINEIVINTKSNYYGETFLHVTGPKLLDNFFTKEEKTKFTLGLEVQIQKESNLQSIKNKKNNSILLTEYSTYREEQNKFSNKKHYGMLWKERAIYVN